jgi:hypothetical protein
MTQEKHPFAWNSPLSHGRRPNQVRARRTGRRSLQHVHTTDCWSRPGGLLARGNWDEIRWTPLLPSLSASVEMAFAPGTLQHHAAMAAWRHGSPSISGGVGMKCSWCTGKLYFRPHSPVRMEETWPAHFTKLSGCDKRGDPRRCASRSPSAYVLARELILPPEAWHNQTFEDNFLATQS